MQFLAIELLRLTLKLLWTFKSFPCWGNNHPVHPYLFHVYSIGLRFCVCLHDYLRTCHSPSFPCPIPASLPSYLYPLTSFLSAPAFRPCLQPSITLAISKIPNTTTSLLSSNHSTGSNTWTSKNIKSFLSPIIHFNPLSPLASVHDPTSSFSPFLFHPNTDPPFHHLITKICKSIHLYTCSCLAKITFQQYYGIISVWSYKLTKILRLAIDISTSR